MTLQSQGGVSGVSAAEAGGDPGHLSGRRAPVGRRLWKRSFIPGKKLVLFRSNHACRRCICMVPLRGSQQLWFVGCYDRGLETFQTR